MSNLRERKKWDFLTAIGFIFTISAVVLSVTTQVYRDALLSVSALKLARQAYIGVWKQMQTRMSLYDASYFIMLGLHLSIHQSIITTVGFIRVVSAVVLSITDEGREGTQTRSALEPSGLAFKLRCKQKREQMSKITKKERKKELTQDIKIKSGWASTRKRKKNKLKKQTNKN